MANVFNPETDYVNDWQKYPDRETLTLTHDPIDGSSDTVSQGHGVRRSIDRPQYAELRGVLGLTYEDAVFLYWPTNNEVPVRRDKLVGSVSGTWYIRSVIERRWSKYYVLACTKAR